MKNLHPHRDSVFHFLRGSVPQDLRFDQARRRSSSAFEVFYQDNGYFTAHVTGAKVNIVDTGGAGIPHLP